MTSTPSPTDQAFNTGSPEHPDAATDAEAMATPTASEVSQASEIPIDQSNAVSDVSGLKGWWKVFASTYVTIFLAEIGDKTQVTTLLMSAESHKPWLVFAGAGTALVCTSLLGVLLGRWLATRLKPRTLEVGAGITLLVITAALGWDIFQGF